MLPTLTKAEHIKNHVLHLHFSDGSHGEIDLSTELDGEVFRPLQDVEYFKSFSIHREFMTLVWPNGADFAPEFLYQRIARLERV